MSRTLAAMSGLACLMATGCASSTAAENAANILYMPMTHKVVEQGILTPVPIKIELPPRVRSRAGRVLVHFKAFGSPDWATLALKSYGAYWSGAIPCLEVSTITGDLFYYIRVHDREGAVIGYSGTRAQPYRVKILSDREHPEFAKAAGRCPDPADCPPGFPGCPSERVEEVPCKTDTDCEGGQTCSWRGHCEAVTRKKHWVSLEVEQDVGVVPMSGACSIPSQEAQGYSCYRQTDGATYLGNPVVTNEPLAAGMSTTRAVVGYEAVLFYTSSVGVRLGYAFRGEGPTPPYGAPFVPFLAEARAVHWFGRDPFAGVGMRPYAFMDAGYSMFDIAVQAHVREDFTETNRQGGNDLEQTLDVYKRAGDGFVGLGAGTLFAVTNGTGVSAELQVAQSFPYGATLFMPRLGLRFGL